MLKYTTPAIAALALASAPASAEVEITAQGPVVALSVTENVAVDPDIANLSAGVTTVEPTAVQAMQANARSMTRVIEQIEALGIDRDDIQTNGINLSAQYRYNNNGNPPTFIGYQASNRVTIVVRDIDEAGPVLDALVASGANDISGVSWGIDDPSSAIDQARAAAFENGRQQAMEYAQMAGFSNVRLLEISENVMPGRPVAYDEAIVVTGSRVNGAPPTPTRPGQVNAGVTVTFSYELIE